MPIKFDFNGYNNLFTQPDAIVVWSQNASCVPQQSLNSRTTGWKIEWSIVDAFGITRRARSPVDPTPHFQDLRVRIGSTLSLYANAACVNCEFDQSRNILAAHALDSHLSFQFQTADGGLVYVETPPVSACSYAAEEYHGNRFEQCEMWNESGEPSPWDSNYLGVDYYLSKLWSPGDYCRKWYLKKVVLGYAYRLEYHWDPWDEVDIAHVEGIGEPDPGMEGACTHRLETVCYEYSCP